MKNLIKEIPFVKYFLILNALNLLLMIFSLSNSSDAAALAQKAKILFENETHDFGRVEMGPPLEYSFKFTNEGDEALIIEKVQPACGCTGAATDGKNEYSKDESGEIKITFNTQGREGHQEKSVTVMTNDGDNPAKELKFSCDVISDNKH